jgi:hypothetical protein
MKTNIAWRRLLFIFFVIVIAFRSVAAEDGQLIVGAGDTQICLENPLACDGIDTSTGVAPSVLQLMLHVAEGTYTTNQLVLLSPGGERWWDAAWAYRQRIQLTEGAGLNQQSLALPLILDTAELIHDGRLRADCADLRVRDRNHPLAFHVDSCNASTTTVTVEIQHIPRLRTKTLYLYYGNPSALDASLESVAGAAGISLQETRDAAEIGSGANLLDSNGIERQGTLTMTIEQNLSGSFTPVATVVNDSNTTILAGAALDLLPVWNAYGWNATLAGVGEYRVHVHYTDSSGALIAEGVAPFVITDSLLAIGITTPNNTVQTAQSINLSVAANSSRELGNCTVLYNDVAQGVTFSTDEFGAAEAQLTGLPTGVVHIKIRCSTLAGDSAESVIRTTVAKLQSFGGATTDLSSVNISNIPNLVLEQPGLGKIQFTENVDLSQGGDLDGAVTIAPKRITIDSHALAALNRSATLTFEGIADIAHPAIFVDDVYCSDCAISSFDGVTLIVTVPHFSSYTVGPNARLDIRDTSDGHTTYPMENVQVTASYTDVATGTPIAGASCDVTFPDIGIQAMAYNGSAQLHEYTRTYSSAGVFSFTISCSAGGYETLEATDTVSINGEGGPVSPTNMTIGKSSGGNLSTVPLETSAAAGNATQLRVDAMAITPTWQGVYGNLSAGVSLMTVNGTMFYDWSTLSYTGEVYTSRDADINFVTIACADAARITAEDSFLVTDGSADAVNNTFSRKRHPPFATGGVGLAQDSCPSTNLYTNGAENPNQYYQVLLADGANKTVYTAILQKGGTGFDGELTDFQMLIPTRKETVEPYYFWVEIR